MSVLDVAARGTGSSIAPMLAVHVDVAGVGDEARVLSTIQATLSIEQLFKKTWVTFFLLSLFILIFNLLYFTFVLHSCILGHRRAQHPS